MDYKFSIKNFKTFGANGKAAEFVIKPITILTGPNNSGKSNLAKFIEFVKNNVDVMAPNINLKKNKNDLLVNDILSRNLDDKTLTFEVKILNSNINKDFEKDESDIFNLTRNKFEREKLFNNCNIKVDIEDISDLYFNGIRNDFHISKASYSLENNKFLEFYLADSPIDFSNNRDYAPFLFFVDFKFIYQQFNSLSDDYFEVSDNNFIKIRDYIVEEGDRLYFDVMGMLGEEDDEMPLLDISIIKGENVNQNDLSSSTSFNLNYKMFETSFLSELSKTIFDFLKENRKIKDDEEFGYDYFVESKIFTKPIFLIIGKFLSEFNHSIEKMINNFKNLSLERTFNKKYYYYHDDKEKFNLIAQLGEKISLNYVNEWLKKLSIADEMKIKNNNELIEITLIRNGIEVDVSQLGKGSQLLLPMILKLISNIGQLFYIEEPESNLHPLLQSKLADFFVNLIDKRNIGVIKNDLHILIETHSEYLIRKLQVLVAKGEISKDMIKIYYLHDDPTREDYITELEMDDNGFLLNEFGEGFIDEGAKLITDLWKIERNN